MVPDLIEDLLRREGCASAGYSQKPTTATNMNPENVPQNLNPASFAGDAYL